MWSTFRLSNDLLAGCSLPVRLVPTSEISPLFFTLLRKDTSEAQTLHLDIWYCQRSIQTTPMRWSLLRGDKYSTALMQKPLLCVSR